MRRIRGFQASYAYGIVALAVLARFIPHIPNFSPVYGALLFGGANLSKRESVAFPLLLLGASDFILTGLVYHMRVGWLELVQLAAFAGIVMVGWLLRRRVTIPRFTVAFLAGPTAFYFVSNFGVWLGWYAYPRSWEGLIACYVAAIPFYGYSLASTFVFGAAFFGTYEFFVARHGHRQPAQASTT